MVSAAAGPHGLWLFQLLFAVIVSAILSFFSLPAVQLFGAWFAGVLWRFLVRLAWFVQFLAVQVAFVLVIYWFMSMYPEAVEQCHNFLVDTYMFVRWQIAMNVAAIWKWWFML